LPPKIVSPDAMGSNVSFPDVPLMIVMMITYIIFIV